MSLTTTLPVRARSFAPLENAGLQDDVKNRDDLLTARGHESSLGGF